MKNNDFKRKIGLKEVLDEASPDQIESFIEKNKNSGLSDEMLENIKTKVFQKTGIENVDTKKEVLKCVAEKNKKTFIRRCIYAAAVVLLAVAVGVGVKYINFGNNPPVVIGETSEDKSAETENSFVSENSMNSESSVDNENSTETENSSNISTDESKDIFQDGDFEIKGINWDNLNDKAQQAQGNFVFNGVDNILDNPRAQDRAWAVAVLNKLETIGRYERPYVYEDGTATQFPDLYLSVAEIEIKKIYYYGAFEEKIVEGKTVNILVSCVVDNGKIKETFSNYGWEEQKILIDIPMTEIGKEYVIGICDVINPHIKGAIEDFPQYKNLLLVEYSYPVFSCDLSEIKNLNEFEIMACCPQIYVAVYDRYMKGVATEDSNETKAYNYFKDDVYRIFGETPMVPKWQMYMDKNPPRANGNS